MNSYEGAPQEFRPRPGRSSLFAFGLLCFLLADLIQTALVWGIETSLAWSSGWKDVLIVDLPVLTDPRSPFYVSPPLRGPWESAGEIVAGSSFLLAAALVFFWPTRTTLASRLFVHILAIVLLVKGTIGGMLARTDLLRSGMETSQLSAMVAIVLGAALLIGAQRRLLLVLQQFWNLHDWTERAGLFATLELPGLLVLAIIFWFNRFPGGAVAAAIAVVPLIVVQLLYSRRSSYERVTTHMLGGAIAAIAVMVAAGIGGSVWLFGSDLLEMPRRALTWSSERGLAMQTHDAIFREQLRDPEATDDEEPKIRWSRDRV